MKRILLYISILNIIACSSQEREVNYYDLDLKYSDGTLYYKNSTFTGVVIKKVPFSKKTIRTKWKDGKNI